MLAQTIEDEKVARATVRKIEAIEREGKKPYKKVSFSNGESVNVFNPHLLEGIAPGSHVEFTLVKNERGFWNLDAMTQIPVPEAPQPSTEAPKYHPTDVDPREHAMRSMNALTNAVSLVTALVGKDILVPTSGSEAFKMVLTYHDQMLKLHTQTNDRGTDTK